VKKISVAVVVVVLAVVAWAGAAYVMGGDVEERYAAFLAEAGSWGPISIETRSYERGVLSSTAETVLTVAIPQDDPAAAPETLELALGQVFRHGPLPFGGGPALARIETRLAGVSVNGGAAGEFLEKFPELKEAALKTSVSFGGTTTSRLRIPPFERRIDEGEMKSEGLAFESEYAPEAKTAVGTLELPGMEFRTGEGVVTIGGIRGRFDLNEVLPRLYVGKNEVTFDGLTLSRTNAADGDIRELRIKDLAITLDSAYENALVGFRELVELAEVTVDGDTFGPAVFDLEMKNLDGRALSEFQEQLQDIYRGAENFNPDEQLVQLVPLYFQLFNRLLEGKPELSIHRLHLTSPRGNLGGNGHLRFVGDDGAGLGDMAVLLRQIEAGFDLEIHERLVRSLLGENMKNALDQDEASGLSAEEVERQLEQAIDSEIEALLAQNFVVREGDKLKGSAGFKNGVLTLNGEALPIFEGE